VLECTANAEVVELTMPAEHETHSDPAMKLPTGELRPERIFGTQPFVRLIGVNFDEALNAIAGKLPSGYCIDDRILSIGKMIQTRIVSDRLQESSA
jgi:hypothetical protein